MGAAEGLKQRRAGREGVPSEASSVPCSRRDLGECLGLS